MIAQKQIRLWIPEALSIFKKFMPATPLPPIYIGAPSNILTLRAELVEKTKSHQVNTPETYDSVMEMIHGDAGDAILIQQKLVYAGEGADGHFCHCLWHHAAYEKQAFAALFWGKTGSRLSRNPKSHEHRGQIVLFIYLPRHRFPIGHFHCGSVHSLII